MVELPSIFIQLLARKKTGNGVLVSNSLPEGALYVCNMFVYSPIPRSLKTIVFDDDLCEWTVVTKTDYRAVCGRINRLGYIVIMWSLDVNAGMEVCGYADPRLANESKCANTC